MKRISDGVVVEYYLWKAYNMGRDGIREKDFENWLKEKVKA